MEKQEISRVFFFRDKIERDLAKSVGFLGKKNKLRDACEYAITNVGKRFRPLIVHLVADALNNEIDVSEAAISIEFFYITSLITKDLLCLDSDEQKRDSPTVHKVFGERIALLTTHSLINAAFSKIYENTLVMKNKGQEYVYFADKACSLALERASFCLGIHGATCGQFLDLSPLKLNIDNVKEIIYKKNITLFEVAFVFGWVFGGGDSNLLPVVKKASEHFGKAFQLSEDIKDQENRDTNVVQLLGKHISLETIKNETSLFKKTLMELDIQTPSFEKLCNIILTDLF